jgi:hypothetical protein
VSRVVALRFVSPKATTKTWPESRPSPLQTPVWPMPCRREHNTDMQTFLSCSLAYMSVQSPISLGQVYIFCAAPTRTQDSDCCPPFNTSLSTPSQNPPVDKGKISLSPLHNGEAT